MPFLLHDAKGSGETKQKANTPSTELEYHQWTKLPEGLRNTKVSKEERPEIGSAFRRYLSAQVLLKHF